MEAKFKIGETLIITDDPDESKRGETRIMGWIPEYHLESLIKTIKK